MKQSRVVPFASVLAIAASAFAFVVSGTTEASATHWRGGNISWTPGMTAGEIDFTVTTYWRRSFFGAPVVNDAVNAYSFDFGDAANTTAGQIVTEVNSVADWIQVTQSVSHVYSSGSSFTASLENCCRLSSLQNNNDGTFRIQSLVNLNNGSSANENSSSPIFLVPDGGVVNFNPFMTADPDGGLFSYALATPAQAGAGFVQPTGLSINSGTGEVTWDTDAANANVGQLWSVSFVVTDNTGNTTPLDILLSMCTTGTQGCGAFQPPDPMPEPATLAVFGLGLIGFAAGVRRRRS